MNEFTKEELKNILVCINGEIRHNINIDTLNNKIQSMIENYQKDPWNKKKIAASHLREAESLISHAMCLLEMKEEQ